MNAMSAALNVAGIEPSSYAAPTAPRVEKLNSRAQGKFATWNKLNEDVAKLKSALILVHDSRKSATESYEIAAREHYACIIEMAGIGESVYSRAQKYIKSSELVDFNAAESEDRYCWLSHVLEAEIADEELDAYNSCVEAVGGLRYDMDTASSAIACDDERLVRLREKIAEKQVSANIINMKFAFTRMNEWQIEQTGTTAIGKVVSALLG